MLRRAGLTPALRRVLMRPRMLLMRLRRSPLAALPLSPRGILGLCLARSRLFPELTNRRRDVRRRCVVRDRLDALGHGLLHELRTLSGTSSSTVLSESAEVAVQNRAKDEGRAVGPAQKTPSKLRQLAAHHAALSVAEVFHQEIEAGDEDCFYN